MSDLSLKPLKLRDLDVVKDLDRAAAERRSCCENFVDLVSQDLINHRAERKAAKRAAASNVEYEYHLAEMNAASRVISSEDKNLSEAIKSHCLQVSEEYSADSIRFQAAKIKYAARKRAFEEQPVLARVFATSPRAKKNEIFDESSAPPLKSKAKDDAERKSKKKSKKTTKKAIASPAAIRADVGPVKKDAERRFSCSYITVLALFLAFCFIAGFGTLLVATTVCSQEQFDAQEFKSASSVLANARRVRGTIKVIHAQLRGLRTQAVLLLSAGKLDLVALKATYCPVHQQNIANSSPSAGTGACLRKVPVGLSDLLPIQNVSPIDSVDDTFLGQEL